MSAEERPCITCHELLDYLYLYLENELPEDRRGEFDRHLAVCEACRACLRQYGRPFASAGRPSPIRLPLPPRTRRRSSSRRS